MHNEGRARRRKLQSFGSRPDGSNTTAADPVAPNPVNATSEVVSRRATSILPRITPSAASCPSTTGAVDHLLTVDRPHRYSSCGAAARVPHWSGESIVYANQCALVEGELTYEPHVEEALVAIWYSRRWPRPPSCRRAGHHQAPPSLRRTRRDAAASHRIADEPHPVTVSALYVNRRIGQFLLLAAGRFMSTNLLAVGRGAAVSAACLGCHRRTAPAPPAQRHAPRRSPRAAADQVADPESPRSGSNLRSHPPESAFRSPPARCRERPASPSWAIRRTRTIARRSTARSAGCCSGLHVGRRDGPSWRPPYPARGQRRGARR